MSRDPRVDAYIAGRAEFAQPILSWLRARFHAAVPEVEETFKWSHPFFMLQGKPFANMASFKAHASFGFWNRQDNETGKEGEAMGQFGRIESLADLPGEAEIEQLIREAAAKLGEGKPARPKAAPKSEAEVPPELAEALAADDAAAATFNGFPPSCRREYCDWVAEAKRPETKAKRVADAVEWMREGKRRNWKYENC
ncbi:YdeI/OmpD-associated family protein [Sphingomonas sp. R-74633]|uniref:YdeI/OmpD-associated family protein n=1 Tax=Sphingomonas sp. R-74633 TaxID=2751188 RepID=UPI0015D32F54|nr:YdeI/OmpD-associated family protein [Sphingomonas sp. R-74633]NYT41238.1 YdeI/OmpD-associated family protein [Sphingomonas sp. R-74633]